MTEETFDFSFDSFRPMGFQYSGVIRSAKVEQPKEATFSFKDREGKTVTRASRPQLVVLIDPIDFSTKTGNPIPEYLPLTQNSRSKLGAFVAALHDLGIDLGSDPTKLEGMEFEWEVKEINFGGDQPTRVNIPVRRLDSLTNETTKAPTMSMDKMRVVAAAIHGTDRSSVLAALAGHTDLKRDAKVIAGVADQSLIRELVAAGLVVVGEDGTYTAVTA